jgi:hypothetical protein
MIRKALVLLAAFALIGGGVFAQTATKYFVAHQGGYIGEATVTVDYSGKVLAASWAEWQGPGGFAEFNSADGKSLVDGAVVRAPDPLANTANPDPEIKGYMFYIYNVQNNLGIWSQFTPAKDGFVRPTRQYERDFEGLMGNPIRAAAYAKAAREDSLVNVTISGLKVTVGKKASETVHYGNMNKADKDANYMPLTADSPGYRYNYRNTIEFFKANPNADYASASYKKAKLTIAEDKNVDAAAKVADYKVADDLVYAVADALSGATFSDFPHYCLELQTAYRLAISKQLVK